MSASIARTVEGLESGGYYLPALSLGYLHYTSGADLFLYFSISSLIGAVLGHGVLKSVSGPKGREIFPVKKETVFQLIQLVLFGGGDPNQFEGSIRGVAKVDKQVSNSRLVLLTIVFVTSFSTILSFPYSAYHLWTALPAESFIPGVLLFLEVVWILQVVTFPIWPNAYLLAQESNTKLEIEERMDEFQRWLSIDDSGPKLKELKYNSEEGGVLMLEYESEFSKSSQMRSEIEDVAFGFSVFSQTPYPIQELVATITRDGHPIGDYRITASLAQGYDSNDISSDEYINKVMEDVELDQEVEKQGN